MVNKEYFVNKTFLRLPRKILVFFILLTVQLTVNKPLFAQVDFVENKGQWNRAVDFKGDFKTGSFFLEKDGYGVVMHHPDDLARLAEVSHGHGLKMGESVPRVTLRSFVYKMSFAGGNNQAKATPDKIQPSYNNYFLGDDPARWAGNCRLYQAVTYHDVYPNIDVRYYSDGSSLKYDFIVRPGGNIARIRMQYEGPTKLDIQDKALIVRTPVGDVTELSPYSYQVKGNKKEEIDCKYVLSGKTVSFQVRNYDPSQVLIIDPSIIFASFTGSTPDNWGYTATPGPDGSLYAGGIVFSPPPGTNYPVSPGAYQTNFGGGVTEDTFPGYDIAIFKFSPNGANRVYATYLGGAANEQPHSMIVDAQGNLIVAGRSYSANFPVTVPRIGPGGLYDIIITKFNAAGSALIGSVRIGGTGDDGVNIRPKYRGQVGPDGLRRNYGDDARSEVILDASNNIILASCTQSTDFPVRGAAFNTNGGYGGGTQDGVILKFSPNFSSYIFGSYFGGSGQDACFVTSINPLNNDLYVGGATSSTNLPGDRTSVISSGYQGDIADGFVTHIRADGSGIIKTTYLGTNGIDIVYGLKFDKNGFPYVMGTTTGVWTITNAPFSNPGSRQFISKLKPDLSAYVYSTVFGSGSSIPNISPIAFLVDRCENVYVSGWGGGINVSQGYSTGTTNNMPAVNALAGLPPPDGADFYFFVMERNAQRQLFGSHYGQRGGTGDHVDGGTSRFDANGVIYQAICANCGDGGNPNVIFPTTPGVWASTNGSSACNQAVVKIEMNFAGVAAGVEAAIAGVKNDTVGCVPFTVSFRDTLLKGRRYFWDFGDGSPVVSTTRPDTTHTFTVPGRYRVMLIAEDPNTCNLRDTSYVIIRAGNNEARLAFRPVKDTPCTSLSFTFFNESTADAGSFAPRTFVWDYGDGSPPDTASFNPPRRHNFPAPGNYVISLTLLDTAFCNSPLTIKDTLRVNPLVDARFSVDQLGCVPYTAVFDNNSLAGTDFIWDFGDGNGSTEVSPTYTYNIPGTYNVRLIAIDTSTCNKVDTSDFVTITVSPIPDAQFDWAPNPPQTNTPTQFTNQSTGAISYQWNFGDGEGSTDVNPLHQYNSTGSFKAELIAFNAAGCPDTFSLTVNAIIEPLLDVPNAFTPGRFGVNGFIEVQGFGIGKMDWRIYNRWGQLVYQTNSRKDAWDGTFKGKPQPMDVYTYTLDVEFTDGKKLRKTGDITLLR